MVVWLLGAKLRNKLQLEAFLVIKIRKSNNFQHMSQSKGATKKSGPQPSQADGHMKNAMIFLSLVLD